MSKEEDDVSDAEVATSDYTGADRRATEGRESRATPVVVVDQDARGNTLLNVTTATPIRRKDDGTINLHSLLDVDSLSICDEEGLDEDSTEDDDLSE